MRCISTGTIVDIENIIELELTVLPWETTIHNICIHLLSHNHIVLGIFTLILLRGIMTVSEFVSRR